MKKKFTFLSAAFMLLAFLAVPLGMRGQSSTLVSGSGTSGYAVPDGWTTSGTVEGGSYLKFDDGTMTSPEFAPHYGLSFTYSVATFGSGTNHPLTIRILNASTDAVISEMTTDTPTSSTYINTGSPLSLGDVSVAFKIQMYGPTGKGVRLRNYSVTGTPAGSGSQTHTLTFVADPAAGGTVSVNNNTTGSITLEEGEDYNIIATPAEVGYAFNNWTVSGTGSSVGNASNASTTFTMGTEDATLTANFSTVTTYTVTYHANVTGIADIVVAYNAGTNVTVASNTFSNPGYAFTKWHTNAAGTGGSDYEPGDVINDIQANIDLYAQWEQSSQTTATLNIQNYANDHSWVNGTQYLTATVSDVTFTAAGGGNTGKYYTSGQEWRYYQGENATITISVPNGYHLVSIKPTYNSNNGGALLNGSATITSGSTVDVSGTSVTFSVGNSGSATNGQVRFTNIDVTYASEGGTLSPSDLTITNASTDLTFDLYNNATAQVINYTTSSTGAITITPASPTTYFSYVHDATNKTITVTPLAMTPSAQTVTINQEADATYYAGTATFTVSVTNSAPLANIAELTAITTGGSYTVSLTDALVTYVNGTNAYLEDASGAVLLYHCADGLAVGDKITGTANVTYQVYNSLPEVTAITLVAGYTLTQGNTVTPTVVTIADLESDYTNYISRYVKIENATVTSAFSSKNCTIEQNGETIVLRDQNSSATLTTTVNDIVTVTAHPAIYNTTHQIAVYEQSQIVVAKVDPTITFNNGALRVGQTLDLSTLFTSNSTGAVTYSITAGDSYATLSGSILTGTAEGSVTVKAEQAETSSYNAGEATATITVDPALVLSSIAVTTAPTKTTYNEGESFDPTGMVVTATYTDSSTDVVTGYTYSPDGALATTDTEITISYTENSVTKTTTQAITVNEVVDYATLPFEWAGGSSADLKALSGVTTSTLSNDYASNNAPYLVKFDSDGKYIQVKTDSQPAKVTIGVKMIGGGSTSYITVKASADGVTFDDGDSLQISGAQGDILTLNTTRTFDADVRYVKMVFTKGSNVGVGPITITKYSTEPVINADDVNLTYDATSGEIPYTITNPASGVTLQAATTAGWIDNITVTDDKVSFTTTANDGTDDRVATFTLTYEGAADKTVTVTQAHFVADYATLPFAFDAGRADIENVVGLTQEGLDTDYSASPFLKFKNAGTWVILKLDEAPTSLSYDIKGNSFSGGTFDVLTSADGVTYESLATYTELGATQSITHINLASTVRYIKWVYTTKSSGNVALGDIHATANYDIYGTVTVASLSVPATKTCTIYEGGQLIHDTGTIPVTMVKHVKGYTSEKDNYYLITVPFNDVVDPTTVTGMTTGNFDLYEFHAWEPGQEWANFEAQNSFDFLQPGVGYLYAKDTDIDLEFTGTINPSTDYEYYMGFNNDPTAPFDGWEIVGNPFACNTYITGASTTGEGMAFYRMNTDGNGFTAATGAIKPLEGVFVQATADNQSFTFTRTAPVTSFGHGNLNLSLAQVVTNRGEQPDTDNAIIRFDGGSTLEKYSFRENTAKLYITQNGKDYSVVNSEAQGEMPVKFKAAQNGTYTLSITTENIEFGYLHLIDNMTGNDVDLLATPSYTFESKTNDYTNRFKLVFSANNSNLDGSDNFAFISDGNIIINGTDGYTTVQVIDALGRIIVSRRDGACTVSTDGMTPGVYMIRLINGNDVKTQKIIVK